jgi:hypothetical protein
MGIMRKTSKVHAVVSALWAVAAVISASVWSAPAQGGAVLPYRVLHEFCKGTCIDGFFPQGDQLVPDVTGKLYGTTMQGARYNFGALYNVFPKHGGARCFKKVLRPFCAPPRCGAGDPLFGHTFLVVDGNGAPSYTAGADYVIDITGHGGNASLIHFI